MTTAIPFELHLIWKEGETFHMDDLKDWQNHCLPGNFWVYVDAYPSLVSHWRPGESVPEALVKGTYKFHAELLPAGFVAGVLSLDTYEEVVGYLSAQAQGLTPDLPTWIDQDWNEIPLHGFPQEKQDWVTEWACVCYPTLPEDFNPNWLDADYIISQFLRFDTNEWYHDPVTNRTWYR